MLEGLEASVISFSELEESFRIDAEYYRPSLIQIENVLRERGSVELRSRGNFISGPFGSEFLVENYAQAAGYRYVRGKDVKPLFLTDTDNVYIPKADYKRMAEYALQKDDILISVVGTLGNASIVTQETLPAIFSSKSTALRLSKMNPWFLIAYLNCSYGQRLLLRKTRGTVQMGLNLPDLRSLLIPNVSDHFQQAVADALTAATRQIENSKVLYANAEQTLLAELGLLNWQPPEPLAYTRKASEVFHLGRMDSEYFSPRVQSLLQTLSAQKQTVGSVANLRKQRFVSANHEAFDYIEISDVLSKGEVSSTTTNAKEAPDRATWYVRSGDVITSTVRPIRRLSAIIQPEQDGFVGSSGFAVLQPVQVPAELLLVYLRLPIICSLMDLYTTASLYPAISVPDILGMPFAKPSNKAIEQIVQCVKQSHTARREAKHLLAQAKRAVEVAIEQDETAGLAVLEQAPSQPPP